MIFAHFFLFFYLMVLYGVLITQLRIEGNFLLNSWLRLVLRSHFFGWLIGAMEIFLFQGFIKRRKHTNGVGWFCYERFRRSNIRWICSILKRIIQPFLYNERTIEKLHSLFFDHRNTHNRNHVDNNSYNSQTHDNNCDNHDYYCFPYNCFIVYIYWKAYFVSEETDKMDRYNKLLFWEFLNLDWSLINKSKWIIEENIFHRKFDVCV